MQTKHFVVLLIVALALAALIGVVEHRSVEGALRFALVTMITIPIAFLVVRLGSRCHS